MRSGGATGVVVKGPDDKSSVAFRFVDLKIKHVRVFNLYLYLSPHEGKPYSWWLKPGLEMLMKALHTAGYALEGVLQLKPTLPCDPPPPLCVQVPSKVGLGYLPNA